MKFADPRESAKIRGRTESERVIGFNAITLRAAFHKYYNGKKYSFKIENSQVGKGGLPPPQLALIFKIESIESSGGGKPPFCIDRRHSEQVIGDMVNTF